MRQGQHYQALMLLARDKPASLDAIRNAVGDN